MKTYLFNPQTQDAKHNTIYIVGKCSNSQKLEVIPVELFFFHRKTR